MLATTRTVIVDEIHAVAGTKRGSHLALSLERLEALTAKPLTRVGLSATQKPIEEVARFLVGERGGGTDSECTDRRQRPRAPARSRARSAAGAARSGDVRRSVDAGLRPARRADRASIAPRSCS